MISAMKDPYSPPKKKKRAYGKKKKAKKLELLRYQSGLRTSHPSARTWIDDGEDFISCTAVGPLAENIDDLRVSVDADEKNMLLWCISK